MNIKLPWNTELWTQKPPRSVAFHQLIHFTKSVLGKTSKKSSCWVPNSDDSVILIKFYYVILIKFQTGNPYGLTVPRFLLSGAQCFPCTEKSVPHFHYIFTSIAEVLMCTYLQSGYVSNIPVISINVGDRYFEYVFRF